MLARFLIIFSIIPALSIFLFLTEVTCWNSYVNHNFKNNFNTTFDTNLNNTLNTTLNNVAGNLDNFSFATQYIKNKGIEITNTLLIVDAKNQTLELYKDNKLINTYTVSTSSRGIGEIIGTKKTPIGLHKIAAKIGTNAPHFAIFKHREFTGQIWPRDTPRHKHLKDYIVTRILHLEGLEDGINRGKRNGVSVDSKERAIYIHGTTMEWKLGKPSSIGCIHMSSINVVHLFEQTPVGTLVLIKT